VAVESTDELLHPVVEENGERQSAYPSIVRSNVVKVETGYASKYTNAKIENI
jgi:hypothetical protein